MKCRFHASLAVVSLVVIALVSACATSPTGRKQLVILPESQMAQMGAQAFDAQKQATPTSSDSKMNAYVRCIALPLAEEVTGPGSDKDWEVVVFNNDEPNAFALPGKKIGVHTGILKVAKTDSQLAAVIGHEIGHVLAKHSNERVSQGLLASGATLAAGAALGDDSTTDKIILAGLGLGLQFGVLLPYGRTQESEADIIGLDIMSKAGFDPRESTELWRNMMKAGGGSPPEFMSTHPSGTTRIKNLESKMSGSLAKYEKARAAGKSPRCTR